MSVVRYGGIEMPKNVRNFWLDARADGRSTPVGTGPLGKDGGLDATVYIRHLGHVTEAVRIVARATEEGGLTLVVTPIFPGSVIRHEAPGGGFTVTATR